MQSPAKSSAISGPPSAASRPRSTRVQADRRGAAIAVLVSRRRAGADERRRRRSCRRRNLETAQRANAGSRGRHAPCRRRMPLASAICASTASRRRRPGTPSPGSTRPATTRFVRLHTNFPHHRDAVCKVLNCKPERDEVQAALMQWEGEAFETAAYAGGGVVAMMRSHDEWSASPHAKALAELPLVSIEKIGDAAPKPWPQAATRSPLSGRARARSVARDRGPRRRPHARGARRRRAADLRSRAAGHSLAHHRHRPRQAHELRRTQERAGPRRLARPAGGRGYFLARLSAARASQLSASRRRMRRASIPASSMCRCRPMAMPGRGRGGAVSTRWCRPRPASTMPKGRRPASTARRNCRRRCSTMPPAI